TLVAKTTRDDGLCYYQVPLEVYFFMYLHLGLFHLDSWTPTCPSCGMAHAGGYYTQLLLSNPSSRPLEYIPTYLIVVSTLEGHEGLSVFLNFLIQKTYLIFYFLCELYI
ncbi:hypothetical protein ACJX0J_030693, partial [Zea mays]